MTFVAFVFAVGLVMIVGRPLVRRLGFPADAAKAVGWGTFVLACVLAAAAIRDSRVAASSPGAGPGDDGLHALLQVLLLFLVVVLAAIGRHWLDTRLGGHGRDRVTPGMRRRALPPAPNFPQDGDLPVA